MALRGSGYPSEEAAADAGRDWRARLMAAFAAARIGADFGDRAGHGGFSDYALAAASGAEHRALNDVHGLMVFECEPAPVFLKVGPITGIVHRSQDRLRDAMAQAIRTGGLSETRQVSYDLYASSAGLPSADGRFALLMAALESMIEPVVIGGVPAACRPPYRADRIQRSARTRYQLHQWNAQMAPHRIHQSSG